MERRIVAAVVVMAVLYAGCGSFFLGEDPGDDPETVFEEFWKSYDRYYAQFQLKGIDWDEVYARYRPEIRPEMTDEELFEVLARMILELEDGHIHLSGMRRIVRSDHYLRGQRRNFDPGLVEEVYLRGTIRKLSRGRVHHGWLDEELGYIRLTTLDSEPGDGWADAFESAMKAHQGAKGLVLDLRNNSGGRALNASLVASRFATKQKAYLVTRSRSGPAHDDFSPPRTWYVEPGPGPSFTNPVVVLTDRATFSAAEWLTLALREYEHITHLGTHSGGGLSMFLPRELPNGWTYTISIQDTRCARGRTYERVGIAPHLYVEREDDDMEAQRDSILEAAIDMLRRER